MTIEFINAADFDPADLAQLQTHISLIKTKEVSVVNKGLLSQARLLRYEHTLAWKAFAVSSIAGCSPVGVKVDFCFYDEANRQYI